MRAYAAPKTGKLETVKVASINMLHHFRTDNFPWGCFLFLKTKILMKKYSVTDKYLTFSGQKSTEDGKANERFFIKDKFRLTIRLVYTKVFCIGRPRESKMFLPVKPNT